MGQFFSSCLSSSQVEGEQIPIPNEANIIKIIEKKDKQMKQMEDLIKKKEKACNQKQQTINELKYQISNYQTNSQNDKAMLQKLIIDINQLSKSLEQQKKQRERIFRQYQNLRKQVQELMKKINRLEAQNKTLKGNKNDLRQSSGSQIHRSAQYFSGNVLDGENDYKENICDIIERQFGRKIKRTQLLYAYQQNGNRNIHSYVDGHSPFVLLVKSGNERSPSLFAGISEGAILPNKKQNKRGWIVSLSNNRVFKSIPGKDAVAHENTYLIFGNQQIRVAGNDPTVFSNLGINNPYYETRGNVQDLIGEGFNGSTRQAKVIAYEIFKIIFE